MESTWEKGLTAELLIRDKFRVKGPREEKLIKEMGKTKDGRTGEDSVLWREVCVEKQKTLMGNKDSEGRR